MLKKIILLIAIAALIPSLAMAGKTKKNTGAMNVQVRDVIVRKAPNYTATSAGRLSYGDQVNVSGEEGNWYRIDSPSGWLPKSALTKGKVKVNPDQKFSGTAAKHDEVALAGKGFNPQIEAAYKKSNKDLAAAFAVVDRIETFGATDGELKSFRMTGKLHTN